MNKNITRSTLTDSLVFGTRISLYVRDRVIDGAWTRVIGRVTGISLESGSTPGVAARDFMVTFFDMINPQSYEVYVKTID